MADAVVARLLIGDSEAMRSVRSLVARVAMSDLPVLVQGDTGTGKELVAEAVHAASGRPGPLVAFNVCAIADSMFEDALFGHVRGAFTGAMTDSVGYLAEADRGTIFLDEVGGLPLTAQAKLLRAIETRQFRPVGARRDRRSAFRVIAATNVPLAELVEAGAFRRDLARRLRAVTIDLPNLHERTADIPLLVRHFVRSAGGVAAEPARIEADAMALLESQAWPDNVRELRQVVELALVLRANGPQLDVAAMSTALGLVRGDHPRMPDPGIPERQQLERLLDSCGWHIARTAKTLGVHRTTLFRRMRRLGIFTPRTRYRCLPASKFEGVTVPIEIVDSRATRECDVS